MNNKTVCKGIINKLALFTKENASSILTGVGAVGVVATAVTTAKATPKAMALIQNAENQKNEELSALDKIIIAGPAYIPSILIGASTIACIFGANHLNKQKQEAITAAYMMLDNSYKKYKDKVKEVCGEETEQKIREEIAKDGFEIEYSDIDSEKKLFYEPISERYFESTIEEIQRAEYELNHKLILNDYANINDFYKLLGLAPTKVGDKIGWSTYAGYVCYGYSWIDFKHDSIELDGGLECIAIDYPYEPTLDYMDY